MKGWIVVGLAVAGTGFAALVGLGTFFVHAENVEARYATYAEAEDDSAVDRGWIPPFVPRSAVRIREFHIWTRTGSGCGSRRHGRISI
jgi:hypothetical protein